MPDINIWLLAGTGVVAGLFGSMLGLGGGFIIVPVITLASGIPIHFAIGSSLVSIVINSCTATGLYISKHMTNLKLGLLLSIMLIPGAIVGAIIGTSLPKEALTIIFGVVLLYIAYFMLPKSTTAPSVEDIQAQSTLTEKDHAQHAWLDDSYFDPAHSREISYQVHRPARGMIASFFGGAVSGMLGVGGGIINVPVMNKLMKTPAKAAIATSSIMLSFTTITGALVYASHGYIVPYLVAPLCLGVYAGSRVGALIAYRIHSTALMVTFALIMALTAVTMILKSLNVFGC